MNAVCLKCGDEKHDPFCVCEACGFIPQTESELAYSYSISCYCVEQEILSQIGPYIKEHGHSLPLPDFVLDDLKEEASVFFELRPELQDAAKVDEAVNLYMEDKLDQAQAVLLDVIQRTPDEYRTRIEKRAYTFMKFWEDEKFQHYMWWLDEHNRLPVKPIMRLPNAYPRAYYWLAFINLKQENFEQGIENLMKGRELEPTAAAFDYMLGLMYQHMNQPEKGLDAVCNITGTSEYVNDRRFAEALLMKANFLTELGWFDEAKKALYDSLPYNPPQKAVTMLRLNMAMMMSDPNREET